MPYALIWPFDFSFSGFVFLMILFLWGLAASVVKTAEDIGSMAKSALENEQVKEVGKGIFEAWVESVFNKR